jgi:hypothetical protein
MFFLPSILFRVEIYSEPLTELLPVTSARNASRADHALAIVPDDAGYNIHGSLIHPNHRRRAADERQTRLMRTRIASAVKESRLIY